MLLDLITFGVISIVHFNIAFLQIALFYSGGYLILKLILFRDIMSGIDAVFGIYLILVGIFNFSSFIYYLMLIWILYKAIFTWVGK
jgi:hypothetical protein